MRELNEKENMKQVNKITNRYTNFILTVIGVAMIGILFKGHIISSAKANLNQFDRNMLDNILDNIYKHHNIIKEHIVQNCK